jgi:hypothetical protein
MATRTMTNVEEHHGVVDVSPPTGGDAGGEGGRGILVAFRERCHLMTLTPAGADRAGPRAVSLALLAAGGLPLAPGVVVARRSGLAGASCPGICGTRSGIAGAVGWNPGNGRPGGRHG